MKDLTEQERSILDVITGVFSGSIWTHPDGDENNRAIYRHCQSLAAKGYLRQFNTFGTVVIWSTDGADKNAERNGTPNAGLA